MNNAKFIPTAVFCTVLYVVFHTVESGYESDHKVI